MLFHSSSRSPACTTMLFHSASGVLFHSALLWTLSGFLFHSAVDGHTKPTFAVPGSKEFQKLLVPPFFFCLSSDRNSDTGARGTARLLPTLQSDSSMRENAQGLLCARSLLMMLLWEVGVSAFSLSPVPCILQRPSVSLRTTYDA